MIKETMFVIAVPDLQKSAAYYRDVLGFQIEEISDSGWRMYVKDNCRTMAGDCPDVLSLSQLGDHSYICYLVVASAGIYYSEIKNNSSKLTTEIAMIAAAPEDKPWQIREFALTTIDGHRIVVGERLKH